MTNEELRSCLEAILFASGEPVELSRLATALEISEKDISAALWELEAVLNERKSGICLLKLSDRYQLCSRQEYARYIRDVLDLKKNIPLSPAALEVLAVVAYNQPVTKSYIEQVRGVDCTSVITTLCQKGLLEERGRLDLPGRPLLYGTTPNFLRCFCLSSLAELPELPERLETPDEDNEIDNEQGVQVRNFFEADIEELAGDGADEGTESQTPDDTGGDSM